MEKNTLTYVVTRGLSCGSNYSPSFHYNPLWVMGSYTCVCLCLFLHVADKSRSEREERRTVLHVHANEFSSVFLSLITSSWFDPHTQKYTPSLVKCRETHILEDTQPSQCGIDLIPASHPSAAQKWSVRECDKLCPPSSGQGQGQGGGGGRDRMCNKSIQKDKKELRIKELRVKVWNVTWSLTYPCFAHNCITV